MLYALYSRSAIDGRRRILIMKEVTIQIPDYVYEFYCKVGQQAGRPVEQVLSDALFKLAGELSLEAMHKKKSK